MIKNQKLLKELIHTHTMKYYFDKLFNDNKITIKSLIAKERSPIKIFFSTIKTQILQIYYPSIPSFIILVIVSFSILYPSHFPFDIIDIKLPKLLFNENTHYQNLIAILAGISALIFALIIFIAQHFNKDYNEAHVLLKKSYLYPILVLAIFSFFNFIWCDVNVFSTFPIILIGSFTIFSVYNLFKILLNKHKLFVENVNLLKDRFKRSIELAIDERIGNNILIKYLEDLKINYRLFPISDVDNYHIFLSPKSGTIKDINLAKLKQFTEDVEKEAKLNGYSFNKNETKLSFNLNYNEVDNVTYKNNDYYVYNKNRFLFKKYKEKVDESNTLIAIDKVLIKDKKVLKKLNRRIKDIFIIKDEDDNFSEEIKLELRDVKEQYIQAIKNENLSKLDESYLFYSELEKTFINSLKKYGETYTFKQAKKERSNFLSGWDEIKWLSNDIKDIFNIAMKTNNIDIISKIGFLPVFIARIALELNDHYLFQQFIDFILDFYRYSEKKTNQEIKSFIKDRSWRYLTETATLIEFRLEQSLNKEELLSLKDFAVYILIIFQHLLEESKKEKDLESFKTFISKVNRLFNNFTPSTNYLTSTDLKLKLDNLKEDKKEKNELKEQLIRQTTLEDIESEINKRKKQMLYGVATWIFEDLRRGENN